MQSIARTWHTRVWSLTWPVILANLTIPLVGLVDTAIMGRMPGASHIGAVSLGAAAFTAMFWLFGFLRMGTTGLTAQAMGADDGPSLWAIALRGAVLALLLALALLAGQSLLRSLAFDYLFDGSAQVERMAAAYFDLRIWSAPATLLYLVELGVLFGLQRMRATLYLGITLNVTNAVLDYWFVIGLGWGVQGVAIGTLISEWTAALLGLHLVYRNLRATAGPLPEDWQQRLRDWPAVRRLADLSANLIVRTFFVQAPFLIFTALGARFGDVTLAANAVLMQLFFVSVYAMDAFAHTAETLAGNAYGARDRRTFALVSRYTSIWAALFAGLSSALFWLLGDTFVAWLTTLSDVRAEAAGYLIWLVLLPLPAVWAFQLDGIFIGTTQIRRLRNAMFASFLLFLAVLALMLDTWHNHAVWLAMLVFMAARAAILAWQYPAVARGISAGS